MNLRELAEVIEGLPYPPETEITKVELQIRVRLPGGVTTVLYAYPDPDAPASYLLPPVQSVPS